MEDKYSEREL